MKDGLAKIVGRRIAGVVVAQSPRGPKQQVFLVFDDGMRFEFWGENFSCCTDVDKAAGLADYVEMAGGEIVAMYGALEDRPPIPPEGPNTGEVSAIRSPWGSPPWKPTRTRVIYSMALTTIAIRKAKGK
jgi:hypothetical protein